VPWKSQPWQQQQQKQQQQQEQGQDRQLLKAAPSRDLRWLLMPVCLGRLSIQQGTTQQQQQQ
jgi:hypothetical protein